MIKLENIRKTYKTRENLSTCALDNISLILPNRGLIFLLGKSGSGKTTLLNILGGLDKADQGNYYFDNENVFNYQDCEWDKLRNCKIGFVFQEFNLIENFSVYQNIELALSIQENNISNDELINSILLKLGLKDLGERKVEHLSGGQQQRVAIARAIAKDSTMILADEPTGNLDEANSFELYTYLREISQKRLVVVVTHDEKSAYEFADRILRLNDGKIVSDIQDVQAQYRISLQEDEKTEILHGTRLEIMDEYLSILEGDFGVKQYHLEIKKEPVPKKDEYFNSGIKKMKPAKKLGLKHSFFFAVNNMLKKKLKYILTVLLFSLTAVLLFFGIILSTYNTNMVISEYYKKYPSNVYYIYQETGYIDSFFINQSKGIDSGKTFYNKVDRLSDGELVGILKSQNLTAEDYSYSLMVNAVFDAQCFGKELIGKAPSVGELVLTDYLINKFDLNEQECIGSNILFEDELLTISGYILTNYMESGIDKKLREDPFNDYANQILEREYLLVYLSKEYFAPNKITTRHRIVGGDLASKDYFSRYITSSAIYGVYDKDQTISLSVGRYPHTIDEVLISNEYLEKFKAIGYTWESLQRDSIVLPNIHDQKYHDYYTDQINLFDYFPNGVKIVGVYDQTLNPQFNANILINQRIYEKLIEEYYTYYVYDSFMLNTLENGRLIENVLNGGLYFDEVAFSLVYELKTLLEDLLPFEIMVIGALLLITIGLNMSCISCSIRDNSKTIGILRALGLTKNDSLSIFILETLIMCTVTILLTLIVSLIGINTINYICQINFIEKSFDIIYFDVFAFLGLMFMIFCIGLISAIFPVLNLAKKHPVEIIKNI